MIRLSSFSLDGDVVPQAIFWRPLLYFTTTQCEGEDGLDRFRAVTFTVDNQLTFDLRNYRGHPNQTVTVYLPFEIQDLHLIAAAVELISTETKLPKYAVAWRRGWDFEFGTLERQSTDR